MSEDSEQKAIITWARFQKCQDGKIADYLHHSPNGGYRTARQGKGFKDMGVLKGFPDLFLFVPNGGYHGLFIELKKPKTIKADGKVSAKGTVSKEQKTMLDRLSKQGYKTAVCFGANQAIDEIKQYLIIPTQSNGVQNVIKQIIDWFKIAKPNPTDKDICTQIGCHFEEVAEMEGALFKHSQISGQGTNLSQAEFYKTIENAEGLLSFVDRKELLDALCDQIVTAVGVGYMMGFDMEGALAEVIRSNHSKFEQGRALFDDNGKIIKGLNYTAPNLEPFTHAKKAVN